MLTTAGQAHRSGRKGAQEAGDAGGEERALPGRGQDPRRAESAGDPLRGHHQRLGHPLEREGARGHGGAGLAHLQGGLPDLGEPRFTAAIPMENPCCSCKLTRVRSACRSRVAGARNRSGTGARAGSTPQAAPAASPGQHQHIARPAPSTEITLRSQHRLHSREPARTALQRASTDSTLRSQHRLHSRASSRPRAALQSAYCFSMQSACCSSRIYLIRILPKNPDVGAFIRLLDSALPEPDSSKNPVGVAYLGPTPILSKNWDEVEPSQAAASAPSLRSSSWLCSVTGRRRRPCNT